MAIYLIRYLNVPPARLPGEGDDRSEDLPSTVKEIHAALLDAFDRQHRVDEAARLVARHLTLGHPAVSIIATLSHALLRLAAHAPTERVAANRGYRAPLITR